MLKGLINSGQDLIISNVSNVWRFDKYGLKDRDVGEGGGLLCRSEFRGGFLYAIGLLENIRGHGG